MSTSTRITVVGAGIIGLTSAVRLAEAGYQVDVLARELPLETTSAVAGGLWLPYLAEPVEDVARWARTTFAQFAGQVGDDVGVVMRPGHLLGHPAVPAWAAGLESLLGLTGSVRPATGHEEGWRLRVPLVDVGRYLPYLVARLAAAGGTLTRLALTALPRRGVVVNCSGIAGRALAGDPAVRPVRGQVLRMSDPGIAEWWSEDLPDGTPVYVLPHGRHLVVGGSAQADDWSTTPDPAQADEILRRATRLVPQLASARVLGHRVGLRPLRPVVRLEAEPGPDGVTVHCYGHGGSGITLSWGCADDVRELVEKLT